MTKSNTRIFILALCVLIFLMGVVLFSAVGTGFPSRIVVQQSQSNISFPQQPNNPKRVNQKDAQGRSLSGIEEIKSHFPKVDYDAPEPTDPAERTKRRNKGKHFDKLGGVSKEPTHYSSGLVSEWDLNLPALPVAQSNAVVIAKTLTGGAFLSSDKGAVYTELSVRIEEILKGDDLIGKNRQIDINRLGGVVRYSSGEESLFHIVGQNMPRISKRYLFFLKAIPESQDFEIITGYELTISGVVALDTPGQFTQYNRLDEATFLDTVRTTVAEKKKQN